ncbi:unnamed protein product, partial [Rotaria sp. Silwood1]
MCGFVLTRDDQDHLKLKLQTSLVHSFGDQITIGFKQESQQVNMLFGDYDCCTYTIIPNGNGYDWQHPGQTFIVWTCDGQ